MSKLYRYSIKIIDTLFYGTALFIGVLALFSEGRTERLTGLAIVVVVSAFLDHSRQIKTARNIVINIDSQLVTEAIKEYIAAKGLKK